MIRDLTEVLDPALPVPIGGKTYLVPDLSARAGLRFKALQAILRARALGQKVPADALERLKMDDDQEMDFVRENLGTVYDEMVTDGVTWTQLKHAAEYAYLHRMDSPEAAERHWNGQGKARPRSSSTTTSTAAGSTTRTPGSTSGTTSPPGQEQTTPR